MGSMKSGICEKIKKKFIIILFYFFLCIGFSFFLASEEIVVKAAVSTRQVYRGEGIKFQIQVTGADKTGVPDTSVLKSFNINYTGGTVNNSSISMNFNGQKSQIESKGYIYNYILTPLKQGELLIPKISVNIGGKEYLTNPIPIYVKKLEEISEYKFRTKVSKKTLYIGEAVDLTFIWYLGMDASSVQISIPFFNNKSFRIEDSFISEKDEEKLVKLPINNEDVIAEIGKGNLEGKNYTTVTFKKIIVPQEAGRYRINNNIMKIIAYDGLYSKEFVIQANEEVLYVRELPEKGKPKNFSGIVGKCEIDVKAVPKEVNVYDPITLTITVKGPASLLDIKSPNLKNRKRFSESFNIPDEMASGKIKGNKIIFTQSIRPIKDSIEEIPSIGISYFDPETGVYKIASSKPIKINVKATKILSIDDMEGGDSGGINKNELESLDQGIRHNYDDLSLLVNQNYTFFP